MSLQQYYTSRWDIIAVKILIVASVTKLLTIYKQCNLSRTVLHKSRSHAVVKWHTECYIRC